MKIAAYAIAKNEAHNIENFLASIKDFDEVVVVDTGSADESVRMLRDAGIRVVEKTFEPFDFSEARNYSLASVSKDTDWCFSLDFNERVDVSWREKFERIVASTPALTAVEIMRYDDLDGMEHSFREIGEECQSFRYGMLGFSEALFFPEDVVFGQALDHMLHYALAVNNAALLVFIMSFIRHPSEELLAMKRQALQCLP